MSRRRQILFAAPFVVIAAGCDKPAAKVEQPPPLARDAGVTKVAPPDAAPAAVHKIRFDGYICLQGPEGKESSVPCPEELLPIAAAGAPVIAGYSGDFRTTGRKQVRGPANLIAPTPASIDSGKSHTGFDDNTLGCRTWEDMSCPEGASCNPPPPSPIACPDALLPHLAPGVVPTSRKDKECFLGDIEVACPTGDLVQPLSTSIPDPTQTYVRIVFRQGSQDCWGEYDSSCPPNKKCNPPEPESVPCPDALLPALVNGDKPTTKPDGTCWWNTTRVRC